MSEHYKGHYDGHHCHAIGCGKPTPPIYLMCGKHWSKVPKRLQHDVWNTYRPGQCDDKRPSEAWHKAADAAIEFVARLENRIKNPKGINRQMPQKENEMGKLDLALLVGAESKAFLADLTKQLDRMEKLQAGKVSKATSVDDDDDDAPAASNDDDEDTAPVSKKAAAKKSNDDDEDEDTPPVKKTAAKKSFDDDEDEEAPPTKKTKAKKLTEDDVHDAAMAKAQSIGGKTGRDKVLAILKKNFGTISVGALEDKDYAKAIELLAV